MKYLLLFLLFISCKEVAVEPEIEDTAITDPPMIEETYHSITEEDLHPNSNYPEPEQVEPVPIDTVQANSYHDQALTLLIEKRDLPIALNLINRAIELNPENANSHYVKGNVYQLQGNLTSAISSYKDAIHLKPDFTDAIMKCAICYGKLNDMSNFCLYARKACDMGNTDACNGLTRFCN